MCEHWFLRVVQVGGRHKHKYLRVVMLLVMHLILMPWYNEPIIFVHLCLGPWFLPRPQVLLLRQPVLLWEFKASRLASHGSSPRICAADAALNDDDD